MTHVLVIEDDEEIIDFLHRGLTAEGYDVDIAMDGGKGLEKARAGNYDLVVLDLMLPVLEGGEVCRALRDNSKQTLVLMLTAKDGVEERIEGLRIGADDYLTKPFSFDELLARMEALLRRAPKTRKPTERRVGDLLLDHTKKKLFRGNREILLTATEFTLLGYLMENAGAVVSRQQILAAVWGYGFDPQTNIVEVYIRYLRKKIEGDGEAPLIKTVRGFGYTLGP